MPCGIESLNKDTEGCRYSQSENAFLFYTKTLGTATDSS